MASRMSLSGEQRTGKDESLMQGKRSDSPEPSCESMRSERSMKDPPKLSLMQGKRSDSPEPSCESMRSERSMKDPPKLSLMQGKRSDSPEPSCESMRSERSMKDPPKLSLMQGKRSDLPKPSCVSMRSERSMKDPPKLSEEQSRSQKITQHVQENVNQTDIPDTLQNDLSTVCHRTLKSKLLDNCERINVGISKHGPYTLVNEIFTELYIIEEESGEANKDHEVRQIETICRRLASKETPIRCNDLFKYKPIRCALTKGVAGIGKTVSVQKFILDWTEGIANQDVLFIFPLPFRELNLMKDTKFSLMELLHHFFPEIKELKTIDCESYKVLFVFDGLDECRLPLDFQNNKSLQDVTESASVDVLLTNLIKKNLLPSALLWITARPAAASQIPSDYVDQVTEIRGFSDPQKEEYFRKRIGDESLADKIIKHMKSSRSLHIMCHIPVFCWLAATVIERVLGGAEGGEIPKTLTQMFIHFLVFQAKHKDQKYHGKSDSNSDQTRKSFLALGKLAFQQLEKGNLIFYEEDLRECGIDFTDVSHSGICTQIFRQEFGLHLGKVFSFVHLSVQEFLAALYAILSFISRDVTKESFDLCEIFKKTEMSDFLKSAVDKALESENGHLDLFLRFLLGLSLEPNQVLLQDLLTQTERNSHSKEEIIRYIKEKIRENSSLEKSISLFHCLNELNDNSLEQEVQTYLNAEGYFRLSGARLSPTQWSALVFVLLNSEKELDEFNLRKYDASDDGLLRLLPVVKASRTAQLRVCNLTEKSCAVLASALSSQSSNLKELNLSSNELQDSGMKLLSAGMENPHCKLETLRLCNCNILEEGCAALALALKSNPSHLKMLNLNLNTPGESTVKLLCDLLKDPRCKLEKLQLSNCTLAEKSCEVLASALVSSLKDLDLSYNELLQDSGVKLLSAGLQNPQCKLESLGLCSCSIKEEGCAALASALTSNPSHLKELNLNLNEPRDSGVKMLSSFLEDPQCHLAKLQLCNCSLTEESCAVLALALGSNSSSLKELDLSNNELWNSGVKLLSTGLMNPHCELEKLGLRDCKLTEESCAVLASTLSSNPSSLRELDLSNNELRNSGVTLLSAGLENPQCKLEKLGLYNCSITEEGCAALASALKSNPSYFKELNLKSNRPGLSGLKLLSDLLDDPHCKLEKLQI